MLPRRPSRRCSGFFGSALLLCLALRSATAPQSIPEQIAKFYEEHNPSKLDTVPVLLTKYEGHEEELLATIKEKYGVTAELGKDESAGEGTEPKKKRGGGRKGKKAAAKAARAAPIRRTKGMREAAAVGQRLVGAITGRTGENAEKVLHDTVAAYTAAAADPAANQTEAWEQMGYYQRGYYQEIEKPLKAAASNGGQHAQADASKIDSRKMRGKHTTNPYRILIFSKFSDKLHVLAALDKHRTGAFEAYDYLVREARTHCNLALPVIPGIVSDRLLVLAGQPPLYAGMGGFGVGS